MSDGLEVIGVHAPAVAAQVVQFQPLWDRATQQLIGDSMCQHVATLSRTASNHPVAVRWYGAGPTPAAVVLLLDLRPESLLERVVDTTALGTRLEAVHLLSNWMRLPPLTKLLTIHEQRATLRARSESVRARYPVMAPPTRTGCWHGILTSHELTPVPSQSQASPMAST